MVIILLLSVLSVFFLNRLSDKTSLILKENHYSVVYARNMSEYLTNINQEITNSISANKLPDKNFIMTEIDLFNTSLDLEKNNITENGEGKLVSAIDSDFKYYSNSVKKVLTTTYGNQELSFLQNKFFDLYKQLMLLSDINEKAIEDKTEDAKISAKKASIQMSFIAVFCFIVAYGFTFSFSSYFNDRFFQLYNGIKEIASNKFKQKLIVEGKDEFYEISLIFNDMIEKINENDRQMQLTLHESSEKDQFTGEIEELKKLVKTMKNLEGQATQLISKIEKKK
jgi:two-component system, NtrC family, sensor histidine kinase KinB